MNSSDNFDEEIDLSLFLVQENLNLDVLPTDEVNFDKLLESFADEGNLDKLLESFADEVNFDKLLESFADEGNLDKLLESFADEVNFDKLLESFADEDSELWISDQFEHDRHQYIDHEEFPINLDVTVKDVANWMLNQVLSEGELYQEDAALHIKQYFGKNFVYYNKNNNLAISKDILMEFLRISLINVVWIPKFFKWRLRQKGDPFTRQVRE